MDKDEVDTYSKTNSDLAIKSRNHKGRNIFEIKSLEDVSKLNNKVTDYSKYLRRDYAYRIRKVLWKAKKVFRHLVDR